MATLHRSGDYSLDPRFDREGRFAAVKRATSRSRIENAIETRAADADLAGVERAIAIYVRESRQRGHSVEHVVRQLDEIQSRLEDARSIAQPLIEPSMLRRAVLRGVLLAFYGPEPVAT